MGDSCAIYYFSATGNSLAVALELAQKLDAPEPISIPGSLILKDPYAAAREASRVGFVFPVHRATLPEMARGFIAKMPKRRDCYYFAVSTHTLFGCNEFWDIDELLAAEGSFLNYARGVKTMGNVGLVDPGSRAMERRLTEMSARVEEIAEEIGNYQENYFQKSFKLLGRLVRAYTKLRRRSIAFKIDKHCTRCGICAQVCPAKNIVVSEDKGRAPIRSDKCEACYACIHWCPANAVGTMTKLHSHYHHPRIKPEQLNPVKSTETECATGVATGAATGAATEPATGGEAGPATGLAVQGTAPVQEEQDG
jgi:ferredoxin